MSSICQSVYLFAFFTTVHALVNPTRPKAQKARAHPRPRHRTTSSYDLVPDSAPLLDLRISVHDVSFFCCFVCCYFCYFVFGLGLGVGVEAVFGVVHERRVLVVQTEQHRLAVFLWQHQVEGMEAAPEGQDDAVAVVCG